MPKLAIYVPKKEMRHIDRWRKKINFSQVFMRALGAEIERLESKGGDDGPDRLAMAATHYQQAMSEHQSDSLTARASQIGCDHVLSCDLSPTTILSLIALYERDSETGLTPNQRDQIREMIGDQYEVLRTAAERDGLLTQSAQDWEQVAYEAYLQGVCEMWRKVCEKIDQM